VAFQILISIPEFFKLILDSDLRFKPLCKSLKQTINNLYRKDFGAIKNYNCLKEFRLELKNQEFDENKYGNA